MIVFLLTSAFGFRKRTSFLVGISLGQISEFSLLIIFLVSRLHYLSTDLETTIILSGLISFAVSTYIVQSSDFLYKIFGPYLDYFETKHIHRLQHDKEAEAYDNMENHLVIIGGHQMGQSIIRSLEKDQNVVVVDFDPDVVKRLKQKGIKSFFGDIADPEIQERAHLDKAKMIISTVPDVEDNLLLIERMNKENKKAKIVVMAYEIDDAKRLYKAGADYVVLPHLAGGRLLAKILKDEDLSEIEKYRKRDMEFEVA
ncbi:MAG: NAD-binding protein [Rhabdochlamydiaceae bacterium]